MLRQTGNGCPTYSGHVAGREKLIELVRGLAERIVAVIRPRAQAAGLGGAQVGRVSVRRHRLLLHTLQTSDCMASLYIDLLILSSPLLSSNLSDKSKSQTAWLGVESAALPGGITTCLPSHV